MNQDAQDTSSQMNEMQPPVFSPQGNCSGCGKEHLLPAGPAVRYCIELMAALERHGSLDLFSDTNKVSSYSTAPLFGEARGKMFGVLVGVDVSGNTVIQRAFSGQFNGAWSIPGWAPPLFCERTWQTVNQEHESEIKKLTEEIAGGGHTAARKHALKQERKKRSQWLMSRLHGLYSVGNFKGEQAHLGDFFSSSSSPPTGAGDCCAPKLLNLAQMRSIVPIGMAEFYWGRSNRSETRRHGMFYPACTEKCAPLIGFMLCGLEEQFRETPMPYSQQ